MGFIPKWRFTHTRFTKMHRDVCWHSAYFYPEVCMWWRECACVRAYVCVLSLCLLPCRASFTSQQFQTIPEGWAHPPWVPHGPDRDDKSLHFSTDKAAVYNTIAPPHSPTLPIPGCTQAHSRQSCPPSIPKHFTCTSLCEHTRACRHLTLPVLAYRPISCLLPVCLMKQYNTKFYCKESSGLTTREQPSKSRVDVANTPLPKFIQFLSTLIFFSRPYLFGF